MKQVYLIIIMIVTSICCYAQEQQGYVKTVGKKGHRGTPINGVIIKTNYAKSSSVVSNSNGMFSFPVKGNKFQVSKIQKNYYLLADEDVIGRDYPYSPSLPVTFSMISLEDYRRLQKGIEDHAQDRKDKELQKRLKQLEEDLEQKKIKNSEYEKRVEELERERSSFQMMISKLSDRYARTDYDDIDSLDILINQYIEVGDYDLADTLVNSKGDIKKRIADTKERENNAALLRFLAEKETQLVDMEKQSIIKDLGRKIQIAQNKLQLDSAQYWIECRADYDSTNVEYQIETLLNLMNFTNPKSTNDRLVLWEHYAKNRKYIHRALEYLKNSGQEYCVETLECLNLLNMIYRQEYNLTNHFAVREAMEIVDKMIEIERKMGNEPIRGVYWFYESLSFLLMLEGKDSQIYQEYYQKSLDDKYEEVVFHINMDVENTFLLFYLYQNMRDCVLDKDKKKKIDKIRLNLYMKHKDEEILKTVDVAQIYIELGETKKAIQYYKTIVAELEKQNELNNNIRSRRQLVEQYRTVVNYLEKVGDYKSMREYTWKWYELYKVDKKLFSTYITRFEGAKILQKHVYACIKSKQFSNVDKMIVESFKLAEDACNIMKTDYSAFIFKNYVYLSQLYAYRRNYSLAISAITKVREMYPNDERIKNIEAQIVKKAK